MSLSPKQNEMKRIIPLILILFIVGLFSGCDDSERYKVILEKDKNSIYIFDSKTAEFYIISNSEKTTWDLVNKKYIIEDFEIIDKRKED